MTTISDFWVSDMYCGQMGLGKTHQVCLAHQLRNLIYAIEAGDLIFAPRIHRLLVQAIRIGQKRNRFDDPTLARFQAALQKRLAEIMLRKPQTEDGQRLHRRYQKIPDSLFVFITQRDLPATNNSVGTGLALQRHLSQGSQWISLGMGKGYLRTIYGLL